MAKKLTRSYDDRWLGGVLSGIAKYFNIKPIYIRVAYIILTAITGIIPGIVVYIVLFTIIPPETEHPGITGLFKTIQEMINKPQETTQGQRRTLTDVEEKDVKKNGRS
ncbi:PspC domain-containing protein [Lactobacillaceae bacterium 24-114]